MKTLSIIAILLLLACPMIYSHKPSRVDYTQKGDNWEGDCQTGHRQSPIDIKTSDVLTSFVHKGDGNLKDLKNAQLHYFHNQLQVNYTLGRFTFVDKNGESHWRSLQFHFHSPAEHFID